MANNKKPGAAFRPQPGLGNTSRPHHTRLGHIRLATSLKICIVFAAEHGEITPQTATRLIQALGLEGA